MKNCALMKAPLTPLITKYSKHHKRLCPSAKKTNKKKRKVCQRTFSSDLETPNNHDQPHSDVSTPPPPNLEAGDGYQSRYCSQSVDHATKSDVDQVRSVGQYGDFRKRTVCVFFEIKRLIQELGSTRTQKLYCYVQNKVSGSLLILLYINLILY